MLKEENPRLSGCWFSLAAATVGSILVWGSIFAVAARGLLYGIDFTLYALALIHPLLLDLPWTQGLRQESNGKRDSPL